MDQIEKQVAKLVDVEDIKVLEPDNSVYRELVLIKVRANHENRRNIIEISNLFRTRIIDTTSGWFRRKKSDVDSRHIYFRPLTPKHLDGRPLVISEFGGFAHGVEGHTYGDKIYGYKTLADRQAFEDKVCELYDTEVRSLVGGGASAFVYTQVSDVEDEINGFFTYDRKVLKINPDRLRLINYELKNTSEL